MVRRPAAAAAVPATMEFKNVLRFNSASLVRINVSASNAASGYQVTVNSLFCLSLKGPLLAAPAATVRVGAFCPSRRVLRKRCRRRERRHHASDNFQQVTTVERDFALLGSIFSQSILSPGILRRLRRISIPASRASADLPAPVILMPVTLQLRVSQNSLLDSPF